MGLRSKFLLILIIFSVVPLLSFFLINQRLFDKLDDEIYHISKVLLLQTTAKELKESADNYDRNFNRELSYIVEHLESYRDAIERKLPFPRFVWVIGYFLWRRFVEELLAVTF
jgi:hypothetical protein